MLLYSVILFGCLAQLAYGTQCVFETLRCAKLYRYFNMQSNFFESAANLDRECRLQEKFFSCLSNIPEDCYDNPYKMPIPEEFERLEQGFQQLCTEGTGLREIYLKEAFCINRQATYYCTSEDYLGADLELETSPIKRCMLTLRSRGCIDYLLKNNCGDDAIYLFRELTHLLDTNACSSPEEEEAEHSVGYSDSLVDPHRYGDLVEKEHEESEELSGFPGSDFTHETVKVNVDCTEDPSAPECSTEKYGRETSEYQTELISDFAEQVSEIFDPEDESSADRPFTPTGSSEPRAEFSSVNVEEIIETPKAEAMFWASLSRHPNMRFRSKMV